MKNKPLSRYKKRKIIDCFSSELTAVETARLLKINRNTVNRYYRLVRQSIVSFEELEMKIFEGEVEIGLSYFSGGNFDYYSHTGQDQFPVLGIFERNGKVFAQTISEVSTSVLRKNINSRVKRGCIVYYDEWDITDEKVFAGFRPCRIRQNKSNVNCEARNINGVTDFWYFANSQLAKYHGSRVDYITLYLKECQFRFNHRGEFLAPLIWNIFKKTERKALFGHSYLSENLLARRR